MANQIAYADVNLIGILDNNNPILSIPNQLATFNFILQEFDVNDNPISGATFTDGVQVHFKNYFLCKDTNQNIESPYLATPTTEVIYVRSGTDTLYNIPMLAKPTIELVGNFTTDVGSKIRVYTNSPR